MGNHQFAIKDFNVAIDIAMERERLEEEIRRRFSSAGDHDVSEDVNTAIKNMMKKGLLKECV